MSIRLKLIGAMSVSILFLVITGAGMIMQLKNIEGSWFDYQEQVQAWSGDRTVTSDGFEKQTERATVSFSSRISTATLTIIIAIPILSLILLGLGIYLVKSIAIPISSLIEGLTGGARQVTSAAEQVSSSSRDLAEGATEQASSVEEISGSLEEIASMTKTNAANAAKADDLMCEAAMLVSNGTESMGRLDEAIVSIKNSSDETAKIVKTIDEIAFQTNLLALNAAVEAARAGDAGKGFAVVAEEVRNLARRAGEAARSSSQLIKGSLDKAEHGVQVADETSEAFAAIEQSATKVKGLISQISAASNEQTQGLDQVNTGVAQMDSVTQRNAAGAEETASASAMLNAQSSELLDLISSLSGIISGDGETVSTPRRVPSATRATFAAATGSPAQAGFFAPVSVPDPGCLTESVKSVSPDAQAEVIIPMESGMDFDHLDESVLLDENSDGILTEF